ncbi:hypothetical protein [Staphylococcus agnetis]|uniref:hypothetical protein n=1 Tax=Staphylococcus agnetis TaxID=985762 RepID=UPI0039E9C797
MKYKVKKKMTLPELLQWGWDNKGEHKWFYGSCDSEVWFNRFGSVEIDGKVEPDETFTVEVEEEITEDTILPSLLVIHKNGNYVSATHWSYHSIRSLKETLVSSDIKPMVFYVLHHDTSLTLIWKDGGMVE